MINQVESKLIDLGSEDGMAVLLFKRPTYRAGSRKF